MTLGSNFESPEWEELVGYVTWPGTRTLVFTQEQIRLISQWATNAWHDADQARLTSRIDSPQEASYKADQLFIETIQEKLRGF